MASHQSCDGVEGLAAQLGDLVGGGHGAQHREVRAAAGVGGEADTQGLRKGHVEEARADEGVRGRAVDEGGSGLDQARPLAVGQVDGVAVDGAFTQKALRLVGVEVVAGLGEEVPYPGDLVRLFGKVRLHQAAGVFAPERAKGVQLFGGRGGRKAGGDDIGQAVDPVPLFQQ